MITEDHRKSSPMPFGERFIIPIRHGTKTVTRRFTPRPIGTILRAKVPIQGKKPWEWKTFANLEVTDCRSVWLNDIDTEDSIREGFPDLISFINTWDEIYQDKPERQWDQNPAVWRIEFKNLDIERDRRMRSLEEVYD